MESVTIALITAVGSIIVALIQASSAVRLARMKEQPAQQTAVEVKAVPQLIIVSPASLWLWVSGILVVSALTWQILMPWEAPQIIHLGTIPWVTCLLAYFRPIRWGFVAGIVTLLSVITVISYFIIGASYTDDDLFLLSLVFTVNAILASGIAYWRSK